MTLSLYYYESVRLFGVHDPRRGRIYRGFKFLFLGWERERTGRVCPTEEIAPIRTPVNMNAQAIEQNAPVCTPVNMEAQAIEQNAPIRTPVNMNAQAIEQNALVCTPVNMDAQVSKGSPIIKPEELLESIRVRGFNAFRMAPPRETVFATYFNLSATLDGVTYKRLYLAFNDLKCVGIKDQEVERSTIGRPVFKPSLNFQKFNGAGKVLPIFEVLEKLQEFMNEEMTKKIEQGEIVLSSYQNVHSVGNGSIVVKSLKINPVVQTRTQKWKGAKKPNCAFAVGFFRARDQAHANTVL